MAFSRFTLPRTWALQTIAILAVSVLASYSAAAQRLPPAPSTAAPGPLGPVSTPLAPKQTFKFTPRAELGIGFTDNVLVTNTDKKGDVVVSPSAGFSLSNETPSSKMTASSDIHYDGYKATTRLSGLRVTGQGLFNADIIDQLLSVDAKAATDQQQINPLSGTPAFTRSFGGNQTQVVSYGATPTVRWNVDNFVKLEAKYDVGFVNYISTAGSTAPIPLNDSFQQSLRATATSGSFFDILTWNAKGNIQRQELTGANPSSERREVEASGLYLLLTNFQVVATGGYDDIRESTLPNLRGGTHATAGFRWTLSQRTKVNFDGGRRYGSDYFSGLITYSPGRSVVLRANYSDSIDTPQSLANQNLNNVIQDPFGNIVDPVTGLAADPNSNPFGLNNQAFRRKAFEVGVSGVLGRNSYNLSGSIDRRISNVSTTTSRRTALSLTRRITPEINTSVNFSYSEVDLGVTGTGITVRAGAQGDYSLSKDLKASLAYYFQNLRSPTTRARENAAVIKLTQSF